MALYTMADTHLSASVGKPMDIFGSRWKDHTEKIANRWNAIVGEKDTVVIGGDISWALTLEEAAGDLHFIDSLHGKKILVRGNHDYWWSTLKKINELFVAEGISTIELLQNNAIASEGFVICGSRGWYNDPQNNPKPNCDHRKIVTREVMRLRMSLEDAEKYEGEKVVFTHFPPVFADYVCEEIVDLLRLYGIKDCYYGHIHGNYGIPAYTEYRGIRFHISSADYLDFRPLRVFSDKQR